MIFITVLFYATVLTDFIDLLALVFQVVDDILHISHILAVFATLRRTDVIQSFTFLLMLFLVLMLENLLAKCAFKLKLIQLVLDKSVHLLSLESRIRAVGALPIIPIPQLLYTYLAKEARAAFHLFSISFQNFVTLGADKSFL